MSRTMQILNGPWFLATDAGNAGKTERWFERVPDGALDAPVPGIIQQVFPAERGALGERGLVRFGAVDYLAEVWLNRQWAGSYEGGEAPFELDVTELIHEGAGKNLLAVRVLNPTNEPIDGIRLQDRQLHSERNAAPQHGHTAPAGKLVQLRRHHLSGGTAVRPAGLHRRTIRPA